MLVNSNGSKLWRLKYRYHGKEKLLSYGRYPLITIAEARKLREASKKLLSDGKDPSVQKKLDFIAAHLEAENTFGVVAAEYLENLADKELAARTISKNRWLLLDIASSV